MNSHLKPLAFLLLTGALGSVSVEAASGQGKLMPLYIGVNQEKGERPEVVFVFSDSEKLGRFLPVRAYSIKPASGNCNVAQADGNNIPEVYKRNPTYDPNDEKSRLPDRALPVFFATVVSAELSRLGYGSEATSKETLPYHKCTRMIWERILQ